MFEEIKSFYLSGVFCDVRLLSYPDLGSSPDIFLCHSLVIASAVPRLKSFLHQEECDEAILCLLGVPSAQVKATLDSIYNHLVSSKQPTDRMKSDWLRSFNFAPPPPQRPRKVKPAPVSRKEFVRDKARKVTCPFCLQTFLVSSESERSQYLAHKRTHFTCNLCGQAFKYVKAYEAHMSVAHQVCNFKCDDCGSEYKRLQDLNSHRTARHSADAEIGPTPCDVCGRTFSSVYHVRAHRLSLHTSMKCSMCPHVSKGSQGAHRHLKQAHGETPSVCDECGKSFGTRKSLRVHRVNVHTPDGEKPFKCTVCDKGFLNRARLGDHVARDHEGRKQYACRSPGCGQAFTLANVRKKHEKRNHGLVINLKTGCKSKHEIVN